MRALGFSIATVAAWGVFCAVAGVATWFALLAGFLGFFFALEYGERRWA